MELFENNETLLQLFYETMPEGVTEHPLRVHPYYEMIMYVASIHQVSVIKGVAAKTTDTPALFIFAPYTVHRTVYQSEKDELVSLQSLSYMEKRPNIQIRHLLCGKYKRSFRR